MIRHRICVCLCYLHQLGGAGQAHDAVILMQGPALGTEDGLKEEDEKGDDQDCCAERKPDGGGQWEKKCPAPPRLERSKHHDRQVAAVSGSRKHDAHPCSFYVCSDRGRPDIAEVAASWMGLVGVTAVHGLEWHPCQVLNHWPESTFSHADPFKVNPLFKPQDVSDVAAHTTREPGKEDCRRRRDQSSHQPAPFSESIGLCISGSAPPNVDVIAAEVDSWGAPATRRGVGTLPSVDG